ncbi:hypothetical protein G4B88_021243 [Cannabis sativa]|uniref:Reverse transcriptase zinc-binding domain-containing protein n=1 Tax=Cannabis sativa TaxID=3483 RepID=A0A7J6HYW6_CANSA|nr:hypothetical protein G4B88_021243 [Cannabis sativa]
MKRNVLHSNDIFKVTQVIQSALPVVKSLFHKKIITSATCSLCSMAWESMGHALFSCCHAKAVWQITNFDLNKADRMKDGDYMISYETIFSPRPHGHSALIDAFYETEQLAIEIVLKESSVFSPIKEDQKK